MELHQLRYFVEVVRTGNFTKAAVRCHVTQPTLSHQIKKLEEELNEPLLQRRKRGALPTAFGERFMERALRVLRELDEAHEEAAAFTSGIRGRLRIGAIPTVAPYLLPGLIKASLARHPALTFEVNEEPTRELLSLLRRGALDLAIVSPPIDGAEWAFQHLLDDELFATLPAAHPLADEPELDLIKIAACPLVLMKEAHCLRGQALELCKRAEVEPEVSIQSSQLETVLGMVAIGLGLSFTPAMALPHLVSRGLIYRSLAPAPVTRPISLIWPRRASRTHAFNAFLQLASESEMIHRHAHSS